MDPKHAQESKVREGLTRLLFDNAGLALVTNLVNGVLWELVIWTSLGSTVVLGRYACMGLVTLQRWRTVLADHRCEQIEVASGRLVGQYNLRANATGGGPKAATPVWHASCRSHG